MKCPFCGDLDSRVVDSRVTPDGASVRRRRECPQCRRRFTTWERREEFVPVVVKKDGRREEFRRHKVLEGMIRACEKTAIPVQDLESFVDSLMARVQDLGTHEVESRWIGEQVMGFLRERDPVAYVRFASVYRNFTDITAFEEEIRALLGRKRRVRKTARASEDTTR